MDRQATGVPKTLVALAVAVGVALGSYGIANAASGSGSGSSIPGATAALVSDVPGAASATDPNLVNGWGLARSATSPWWVADNGPDQSTSKATLYTNAGVINPLVVNVVGGPTGTVFTGIAGNFLTASTASPTLAPSNFVFASEDGNIRAWRGGSTAALVTPADGGNDAIYKGLAIAQPATGGPLMYATDFHNARVDMFNGAWHNVTPANAFTDSMLPGGYAPFGIQTIGSRVFVTFAKQDADAEDEVAGQGRGFVDAFDLNGNLLERVAQHGQLDAPWGVALAPATFGRYAGDLLVGNFGDGQINAYEETSAGFQHRGTLRDIDGKKLAIDGLWALGFGNAGSNGSPDTLFFTAGPDDESHGLFGTITTD